MTTRLIAEPIIELTTEMTTELATEATTEPSLNGVCGERLSGKPIAHVKPGWIVKSIRERMLP